jgi:hypothetical protein
MSPLSLLSWPRLVALVAVIVVVAFAGGWALGGRSHSSLRRESLPAQTVHLGGLQSSVTPPPIDPRR